MREAEIRTIPKLWEKWIPTARQKYVKTKTLQNYVFLNYFSWSKNPYNFHNMGEVNSHSTEKLWENTNIPKVWVSYIYFAWNRNPYNSENMGKVNSLSTGNVWKNTNITKLWVCYIALSCEALNHTIHKMWEKWNLIRRQEYEKKQTFRSYRVFRVKQKSIQFPKHEKSGFP